MLTDAHDAVVGGGVMGLSLTRALAQRGRRVTLYSEAQLAEGGASAAPVALLNPFRGRTGRAQAEDHQALAVMWRWVGALRAEGWDPGTSHSGVLRIADSERQQRAFANVTGLTLLTPKHIPAPFRGPHGGALASDGGWIAPARYLAALASSATRAGATLQAHQRIDAVEPDRGCWRLTSTAGRSTHHTQVWLCIGAAAWPAAWSRTLLSPPAFERLAGDIVATNLLAPAIPLAGGSYVGPLAGQAAIGGHHRPPGPTPPQALSKLVHNLRWAWPELEPSALQTTTAWWGVRAHLPGNRPLQQQLAPGVTWLGGLAGRGFLVAAAVAEGIVADITTAAR